jgi:hypothetical protein
MKVPKNVLVIGSALSITYRKTGSNRETVLSLSRKSKGVLIAINKTHTALFLFPNKTTGKKQILTDRQGKQSGRIHTAVEYEIPSISLNPVGVVIAIQYSTDWWEDVFTTYGHSFETEPTLYGDKYSRFTVMGIKPRHGRIISPEGITG